MTEGKAKPRLISDPSMVDAEWFTDVLQHAGVLDGAAVAAVAQARIGTGQAGQNVAFALTYDGEAAGAPATVVGKFPSPEPESRRAAVMFRLYEREVRFYQEIAGTVDIRVPACYHADIEPETGEFVLLLEDLRPAVQGDQLAGCSLDQAMLAMNELAALHAPRWDDPTLASIEWMGQPNDEQALGMIDGAYRGLWPGFAAQYGPSLTSDALALGEALGASMREWRSASAGPTCVVHGDYRLDNMLFGTEDSGYPLATVDWQTVAHGRGIADVAYFIGNGLPVPDRRKHEMALLKRYHDEMRRRGVVGYEWSQCLSDYKAATLSGIVMTVIASQVVHSDDRGVAMFAAMAERHFAHAIDHQAGETLAGA
jgi:aminoglycoside/choline kinase family phosphotransferase